MNRLLVLPFLLLTPPASAPSAPIAIVDATVHTLGPAGTLQHATVLIEGGKIKAVGTSLTLPPNTRQIAAGGKVVTPGLFDSLTRLGVVEVSAVRGSRDSASDDDRITAAFSVVDALNPRSSLIPVNRIDGLTRAVVAPANGHSLIAGQGAVIHLGLGNDLVVRTPVAMFATLGEAGAELAGGSRGTALLRLREAFEDARDYAAHRAAFETGDRRAYALSRLDLEALGPVARGELPLVVTVHRASDIEAVLRFAKELKLRLILAGVTEGWRVAPQIAAAQVPVLLEPLSNLPNSFERLGATLENAARLKAAGVAVALMTGDAHNARNLRQGAGNAVAYGLPWEEGLRAITLGPAKIWGLAGRLGSLEAGKEADLVIWDGDPLELTTSAEKVFIRGEEIPMTSRQLELRDRYRTLAPR